MEVETSIAVTDGRSWLKSLGRGRGFDFKGFWAIADQGVVSLGNFFTTIILARAVSPEVYGIWTVIFGLMLFFNGLHASLITYPLSVRLASGEDDESGRLIMASLALTALLALPQSLILFGVAFLLGGPVLALWVSLGLLFWQLQETTRRALMARLAFRASLLTDAISYLGQAGVIWIVAGSGKLSAEFGFGVIALTCGVAGVIQLIVLHVSVGSLSIRECAQRFWETGHWVLGSNLAANFSLQAVPWALFLLRGPAEAAGFQAVSNLLGVANPIMLSLGNIVVPSAARAHVKDGLLAARRVAVRHGTQGGLLLLPYMAALLIFPRQFLGLFYGSGSPYVVLENALRLLTVFYALHYVALTLKFLLNAIEENRPQFVAELCGSLLIAGLVVPMVLWFGLPGAILAIGLWITARLVGHIIILRHLQV
jgi:O-antigen/teichoic acid export membrane protein